MIETLPEWASALLAVLGAYLLGSLPSAHWICRLFYKADITQSGSGNPGMTNVWRTFGWKPAIPVALLDAAKGYGGAALGALGFSSPNGALLCALVAILGHSFTVFAGFKGGKGVLTAFGAFLFLAPWSSLSALGLWVSLMLVFRFVSLASMGAACLLPAAVFWETGLQPTPLLGLALLVSGFVLYRHRSNFQRLLRGEEKRFSGRSA
jgi:glycerol-3-phosphate acyltransferase PlsY